MKLTKFSSCLLAFALVSSCAKEPTPSGPPPDAVTADPGHYSLILENDAVRILRISYGPGEKSTLHRHPDAIVVPLATGKTRFTLPDGTTRDADLIADTALYMNAESHNPQNVGTTRSDAILIEFKTPAPGTATLPAAREGMSATVLAEGARATAMKVTADPTFAEPAGTTHDYDQVVIALGPVDMQLAIDGQPARNTWARGDVAFIKRGTPHASANMSGAPVEFVIVAIK